MTQTHRFGLVSKEVDGGVVVLLHDAEAVPFIPAVRKHVKADLTSCGHTKTDRLQEMKAPLASQ